MMIETRVLLMVLVGLKIKNNIKYNKIGKSLGKKESVGGKQIITEAPITIVNTK
jgi:hypothetical protein